MNSKISGKMQNKNAWSQCDVSSGNQEEALPPEASGTESDETILNSRKTDASALLLCEQIEELAAILRFDERNALSEKGGFTKEISTADRLIQVMDRIAGAAEAEAQTSDPVDTMNLLYALEPLIAPLSECLDKEDIHILEMAGSASAMLVSVVSGAEMRAFSETKMLKERTVSRKLNADVFRNGRILRKKAYELTEDFIEKLTIG